MEMISLLFWANASWKDWCTANLGAWSFFKISGELVKVDDSFEDSLLAPLLWPNGTASGFRTSWPELSMSKSVGRRDGWCVRCWLSSVRESSNCNIPRRTGFCRSPVRSSKSSRTWEATLFRLSPVESPDTLCCTLSNRAKARFASET